MLNYIQNYVLTTGVVAKIYPRTLKVCSSYSDHQNQSSLGTTGCIDPVNALLTASSIFRMYNSFDPSRDDIICIRYVSIGTIDGCFPLTRLFRAVEY
mmetsp:Transcript_569/g.1006  ORF Transcript_569/g.1006 Transcript_569/m.1006 type:complete len:97 (-) Transcript_569:304-594(-)